MELKRISLALLLLVGVNLTCEAQNGAATLLKEPQDWRFEHIPIPPGFARDVKYTGYEEARFAPGVFDNKSTNYFTYALAVSIDGTPDIGTSELKDFLEKYYRGLSIAVGRRKQMSPDTSQMTAEVSAVKSSSGEDRKFEARMPFFDPFTDGRKIVLNMEIRVIAKPESKKSFLMLLISPQGPEGQAWKKLREIAGTVKFE